MFNFDFGDMGGGHGHGHGTSRHRNCNDTTDAKLPATLATGDDKPVQTGPTHEDGM